MDKFQVTVKDQVFDIYEHTIKKGLAKGETYWRPEAQVETEEEANAFLDKLVTAYGAKVVAANFIVPKLTAYSNMLTKEAVDEAYIAAGKKDDKGQLVKFYPDPEKKNEYEYIVEDQEKWDSTFIESYSKMFGEMSARGESVAALTAKLGDLVMAFSLEMNDAKSTELGKLIKQTKLALEAKKHKDDDSSTKSEIKPETNGKQPVSA